MAKIPPRTISAIKEAVYSERARLSATNSGMITRPPVKLKPSRTGYSQESGKPVIIAAMEGKTINTPRETEKTGNCSPVSSCLFRAQLDIKNIETKA